EPHAKRYLILGLGTGGRPDAILNLDWTQIDLPGGSIRLNALARLQTSKRRAEVPICSVLASHLRVWGEQDGWDGPVIRYRGQAVSSIKKSWQSARNRSGIACNPYSLRHTVGKWL